MRRPIVAAALWLSTVAGAGAAVVCDIPARERMKIQVVAHERLARKRFSVVETGIFAYQTPKDGEHIAGNPNTLYGFAGFNDSGSGALLPRGYPTPQFPVDPNSSNGSTPSVLVGLMGAAYAVNEAVAVLLCTPPPARYFGITAYVFNRLLTNDSQYGSGDGTVVSHVPVTEIGAPFNFVSTNVTAGLATEDRKTDPSTFWRSAALLVFGPNREVFEEIADAYVQAGLPAHAVNFYPFSAQTVRLHDRSKPWDYDYPDLISILSRASYFQDQAEGEAWGSHKWPAFFIRAPAEEARFLKSAPAQRILDDRTGDSEAWLLPALFKLLDAVVEERTRGGKARLVRREQLVAIRNDRATQLQCLNNMSFVAAVDPIMTHGGCGFGTRDCRYGTSAALDMEFGDQKFFVIAGVRHEALKHASYSSIMLTSVDGYEKRDHTITLRDGDGAGMPERYLPGVAEADQLFALTLARSCPEADAFCRTFNSSQFAPHDRVYWMERAYLQLSTGVGPNIDEHVMSFVLTFEGEA